MRHLHSPRCTLEPLLAAHAEAMFQVLADPAIYDYENAPPASLDGLRQRYQRLESRRSADGRQLWLNWVLRLPGGALAGHVQATVLPTGAALVAYELASAHWRQGIGSAALAAMLDELAATYGVHTAVAVLKARNQRSAGLLLHLGFVPGAQDDLGLGPIDDDEIIRHKRLAGPGAGAATTTASHPAMTVEHLFIRPPAGGPLVALGRATVVAGAGIVGDRYFGRHGEPGQNLTLVEAEAIEAFLQGQQRPPDMAITGRNLVTRGVRLNDLVGREFHIGAVRCRGVELCDPCLGLGQALQSPALTPAQAVRLWVQRGGLRADVLTDGEIVAGAALTVLPA